MRPKDFFEDFRVGERLITPSRTITEADLVMFAAFTGDWHPLHTDAEYAKGTIFGERIAHGMLGLVVGSALAFRLGYDVILSRSFIAFYGMDRVRFTAPIRIGDTIHLESEVVELREKDDSMGIVISRNEIKNQRGETCISYTTRILCRRRPG